MNEKVNRIIDNSREEYTEIMKQLKQEKLPDSTRDYLTGRLEKIMKRLVKKILKSPDILIGQKYLKRKRKKEKSLKHGR